jgi:phosphoglycolate phosphatase
MSRFASVIFDLDGTLIDSAPGVKESFTAAVALVFPGIEFDPDSFVIGPPLPKMFEAACPMATSEQIPALVTAFRADYNAGGWKKTRVFDGVEEALASLASRGVKMYVVTNKPLDISRKILIHFKLDGYFEDIRSLDSVTPAYANKTQMLKSLVLERNLKPEQCVLIGDTIGDASAAKAVAMPFVWVSFGYGKRGDFDGEIAVLDSYASWGSVVS